MGDGLKRILLVEDDARDIEMTLEALAECRVANRTDVVRDGSEALDYLYRRGEFASRPPGEPVVVLLDIRLPKINGLEVLKQMKSDERLKLTPVVILSSSREDRDLAAGYALNVNAYVVKPVDSRGFVEAVKACGLFWAMFNEPPAGSAR